MIVNRIQRLVCVACGTDQRVKLRSVDGVTPFPVPAPATVTVSAGAAAGDELVLSE